MKLSEAIRAGAKLKPQGHGGLLVDGKTCALGAACEVAGITIGGGNRDSAAYDEMERRWPFLNDLVKKEAAISPILVNERIITAVYLLNDCECFTREQIADWVEQFEADQEAAS